MRVAAWIDAEHVERVVTSDGKLIKLTEPEGFPSLLDQKRIDETLTEFVERVARFYRNVQGVRRTV